MSVKVMRNNKEGSI